MVFVTWSSLFSFSGDDIPKFEIPHLDKAVHFTFYFVAVILGVMSFREVFKGKYKLLKSVLIIGIFMIIFGTIIEVLQYKITPDRKGDFYDGLANSVGALSGALVMKTLFSRKWGLNWGQ